MSAKSINFPDEVSNAMTAAANKITRGNVSRFASAALSVVLADADLLMQVRIAAELIYGQGATGERE